MAMFKAFKPSGMEKIARSMGYQGNMQGFQDYVSQDPMRQQQMQNYTNQAMQMARGGVVRKMQTGGMLPVGPGGTGGMQAAQQSLNQTGTSTTQAGPQQYQLPTSNMVQKTTMAIGEEDGQQLPELPDGKFLAKTAAVGEDEPIPNLSLIHI